MALLPLCPEPVCEQIHLVYVCVLQPDVVKTRNCCALLSSSTLRLRTLIMDFSWWAFSLSMLYPVGCPGGLVLIARCMLYLNVKWHEAGFTFHIRAVVYVNAHGLRLISQARQRCPANCDHWWCIIIVARRPIYKKVGKCRIKFNLGKSYDKHAIYKET